MTRARGARWKALVPLRIRKRVRSALAQRPVDLGDLRRTHPIDLGWGGARGKPVDRAYIEAFLDRSRADISGHVLEVGGSVYTRQFGSGVARNDVLHIDAADPRATIVADLADAPHVPSDAFDCLIATQVLQYIFDTRAALRTIHRILAPGGVLLATVPGITHLSPVEDELWGDWWRFTARSARRLAEEAFGVGNVDVTTFGNVLTATAMLYGLASEDFTPGELDRVDPLFEVILAIRATKRGA